MQTLRVTHEHYSIFEIYHVKYTNLVQSYTWPHFQYIVLLNLMFTIYHVKYKDLYIFEYGFHIYAQCRL